MAKSKYMQHYCAYCHRETKMALVGEMQAEGNEGEAARVWYRCTRCKHSALLDRPAQKSKNSGLAEIDHSSFVEYSKEKVFTLGQTIFHSEWNDYGRVTAKHKISSGTSSITVTFEKLGERRLLENVTSDEEKEVA
ncbi:MAG TPA: hypothetical protein VNN76_03130 [Bacteroidota bacterium]|nr:hypothetical protein [Bacteroidota bacterium]